MAVFPWGVACGGDVALVRGLFVPARGGRAEVALDHLGVEDGVGHLNDPVSTGAGVRKGSLVPGHDAVVVELGDEAVEGVAHDAEGVGDDARGELGRAVRGALGIPGLSGVRRSGRKSSHAFDNTSQLAAHIPRRTPRFAAASSMVVPPVLGMWMNTGLGCGVAGADISPTVPTYDPRRASGRSTRGAGCGTAGGRSDPVSSARARTHAHSAINAARTTPSALKRIALLIARLAYDEPHVKHPQKKTRVSPRPL